MSSDKDEREYKYDAPSGGTELIWRCLVCGDWWHRKEKQPERCPTCGADPTNFALITED